MNNEIIVVKQLPVIVEQLQTVKADVMERVEKALSLICTEETVVEVKNVRAALNKEFKDWEERRKEVKKAIIAPYEQFETVYKDCITDVFKTADTELKTRVDVVENDIKEKKTAEVEGYFYEYAESKGIGMADGQFFTFDKANINVTLSASMKSLKEQAKAFIDRICDDLNLIETQEHKNEIMFEYRRSLNVSGAIKIVLARHQAIEEEKAREAERQAKIEAEQKAAEKVETVIETLTPPTVVTPAETKEEIYTLQFTVKGTKSQLRAVKEFLEKGGYEYK